MAIDLADRTVAYGQFAGEAAADPANVRRHLSLGLTVAVGRTAVLVALASLAILVLLPAALAAQAAITI
jgi:hypothetical protein